MVEKLVGVIQHVGSERIIMVKSKELKMLRKQLEKVDRILTNPIERYDEKFDKSLLEFHLETKTITTTTQHKNKNNKAGAGRDDDEEEEEHDVDGNKKNEPPLASSIVALIHYHRSKDFVVTRRRGSGGDDKKEEKDIDIDGTAGIQFDEYLNLFITNMSDHYLNSSFGLDIESKKNEFMHPKAKYLRVVVVPAATTMTKSTKTVGEEEQEGNGKSSTSTREDASSSLIAFVHFRYCYDDDDEPSCVVLYVYEIQVMKAYRSCGIGRRLMNIIEQIAKCCAVDNQLAVVIKKVMLTVFKKNTGAMNFYMNKLGYIIDETSPSQWNHSEDYEILSKMIA